MEHNNDITTQALAPRYYTDPTIFNRSIEQIFFKTWQVVCHISQLPQVGDYVAISLYDQDLFVIRGKDGNIRGFYNVCQHRGHPLVDGTGRARVLVCPYHAWSYALDGRLRGAPNASSMIDFDKSKICLTEVRCETFLGFVFINLDADAENIGDCYPGVEEQVDKACPDLQARMFAHAHSAKEGCNWLAAVENYNECYHCGHCHRSFASGVIDPRSYDIRPFGDGAVLRHTAQAARGDDKWYESDGSDYLSFFLFPAFSLQIYPGGMVNTYHWRPLAHNDTEVFRTWFSADGIVDDRLQKLIDLDRETTFAEDLMLVKAVQRGMGSKGYRPGPLVISKNFGINSEHSIAALHDWLREAIDP